MERTIASEKKTNTAPGKMEVQSGAKKVFKKNTRRVVRREDRARSEFAQKIISIGRYYRSGRI